jgi:hypothetical protein
MDDDERSMEGVDGYQVAAAVAGARDLPAHELRHGRAAAGQGPHMTSTRPPDQRVARSWSPSTRCAQAIAVALAAVVGGAGCGAAGDRAATLPIAKVSDQPSAIERSVTLKLQSQQSTPPAVIGKPGSQPGALMLLNGMLFQAGGTAAIGRSQAACTRTAPGNGEVFECQITFIMADGTIDAQSISSVGGPAEGSIGGGTHAYADARGTFSYRATGNPRVDLTLNLQR